MGLIDLCQNLAIVLLALGLIRLSLAVIGLARQLRELARAAAQIMSRAKSGGPQ